MANGKLRGAVLRIDFPLGGGPEARDALSSAKAVMPTMGVILVEGCLTSILLLVGALLL